MTTMTVYRVTPACAITYANNTTVNLSADMAIVTDGSIAFTNQTTFQSGDGNAHTIFFIMPTGTSCTGGNGNFTTSSNTSFVKLRVVVYTPCTVSYSNNDDGLGGTIYAGTVNITNLFNFTYNPLVFPGAGDITGYNVDIAYIREIAS